MTLSLERKIILTQATERHPLHKSAYTESFKVSLAILHTVRTFSLRTFGKDWLWWWKHMAQLNKFLLPLEYRVNHYGQACQNLLNLWVSRGGKPMPFGNFLLRKSHWERSPPGAFHPIHFRVLNLICSRCMAHGHSSWAYEFCLDLCLHELSTTLRLHACTLVRCSFLFPICQPIDDGAILGFEGCQAPSQATLRTTPLAPWFQEMVNPGLSVWSTSSGAFQASMFRSAHQGDVPCNCLHIHWVLLSSSEPNFKNCCVCLRLAQSLASHQP